MSNNTRPSGFRVMFRLPEFPGEVHLDSDCEDCEEALAMAERARSQGFDAWAEYLGERIGPKKGRGPQDFGVQEGVS